MKRGQVTIFIIVAVIIVVIGAAILIARYSQSKEELSKEYFVQKGIEPSLKNIQEFSLDCLEENANDALELIGIQGGYYKQPQYYYDLEWAFVPYYYHEGLFLMPSQQTIEQQLSLYIDEHLPSCIEDITFKNFQLSYAQPKTTTSIEQKKVTFTTQLPLSIDNNGKTSVFELEAHPVSVESSLFDIIKVASYITDSHKEDPAFMCINCITQLSKEKDLYVDFIAFEKDSTLVMIIENKTRPEPYVFEFLNKYSVDTIADK
jgi:hypothetical protein